MGGVVGLWLSRATWLAWFVGLEDFTQMNIFFSLSSKALVQPHSLSKTLQLLSCIYDFTIWSAKEYKSTE